VECDISNRDYTCPTGYCCVRDELILEDVLCKAYGRVNDICTTVVSESECPCLDGLFCKTVIVSSKFTSIYGSCHNRTADMVPTSTISSNIAGTSGQTTPVHNHPPVIHLPSSKIVVPKNTGVGHSIIRFSVSDSDSGLAGKINCYIIHPPYFSTAKKAPHRFEIVVLSSLQILLPQTLTIYIHCKDGGQHAANNVARLNIQITNEVVSSASRETTKPVLQSSTSRETTKPVLQSSASRETSTYVLQSSAFREASTHVLQSSTSRETSTHVLQSSAFRETSTYVLQSSAFRETSTYVLQSSTSRETSTHVLQSSTSRETSTHVLQSSTSRETSTYVLRSSAFQEASTHVLQTTTSSMKTTNDLVLSASASVVSPSTQKVKGSDPLH
jgi:hypothetical protein